MTVAPRRQTIRTGPGPLRLVLTIRRTDYDVRPVRCDPIIAERAFRLAKADGTLYDVVQTPFGPECDCPDFVYRRQGLDPAGCKHVQALVACGLIAGLDPMPARP